MSVSAPSTRSDIGSLPNVLFPSTGSFRYASTNSENEPASASQPAGAEGSAPSLVIWGTDVSVDVCKRQFIQFLRDPRFTVEDADMDEAKFEWPKGDEPRPLYLTKLEEILHVPNEPYLTLNCNHVNQFCPNLYRQLLNYPTEVIQIFDMGANELFQDIYPDQIDGQIVISVRPFNLNSSCTIRGLNPHDVGRLVKVAGMVVRCSTIIPEMIRGFFKCSACFFTREAPVEGGHITEPHVCTACNSKFSFTLIHNRCKFVDRQLIKLQEAPDDMPAGQTPSTIALIACADLVDRVNPGDRVVVTGIYRASTVRVIPRQRKIRSVMRTSIDVVHYRRINSERLHDEASQLKFSAERIDKLKAMAQDENIYDKLANSIGPAIYGHLDVKKGILLQLFGGTRKEAPGRHTDPKLRHFRAELNLLLCGDPGTSKSQLLQYVHKLVPRGQYTSGKGSSAVGLTAYVTRDIDTKQLVLQTGALVMCDGGICCIDEFDKMSDSTKSVLHEVMEQQTLSIAKAGIVCQLNARTSILAAANPVESEWNLQKSVLENIRMTDTLLSRFDLVFLILDPDTDEYDRDLATHLVSLYYKSGPDDESEEYISHALLKDYIAYARANIHPKLTEESCKMLGDNYAKLRKDVTTKGMVSVYPRNLESLIRLSEAHAKMRLSIYVEPDDVAEALRMTKEALLHDRTDPNTAKIIPH